MSLACHCGERQSLKDSAGEIYALKTIRLEAVAASSQYSLGPFGVRPLRDLSSLESGYSMSDGPA